MEKSVVVDDVVIVLSVVASVAAFEVEIAVVESPHLELRTDYKNGRAVGALIRHKMVSNALYTLLDTQKICTGH